MFIKKQQGFTLLEILIALFIFTIVSVMLMTALHSMMNINTVTEKKAKEIRMLQRTFLVMSRELTQAINRPVANEVGKTSFAFVGEANRFMFTHAGFANPNAALARSNLQRTGYEWRDNQLWRLTWDALDLAPDTKLHQRAILDNIIKAEFYYLDNKNHFQTSWPASGQAQSILPRAVKVILTIKDQGSITQLYVLPTYTNREEKNEAAAEEDED